MKNNQLKKFSKLLSLVLRHKPEAIGITLDENGWASVDELIKKIKADGKIFDIELLQRIVSENDKKRFAFSEDKTKIRASQGHSISIDLNLKKQQPPEILYHGTAERNIPSIKKTGLEKRNRQHVHLSDNIETATAVGTRYGKPVILEIDTAAMHAQGFDFYLSANGVWLSDHVPISFIKSFVQ